MIRHELAGVLFAGLGTRWLTAARIAFFMLRNLALGSIVNAKEMIDKETRIAVMAAVNAFFICFWLRDFL